METSMPEITDLGTKEKGMKLSSRDFLFRGYKVVSCCLPCGNNFSFTHSIQTLGHNFIFENETGGPCNTNGGEEERV
jgi:hypothetical protein